MKSAILSDLQFIANCFYKVDGYAENILAFNIYQI